MPTFITSAAVTALIGHARKDAPLEACGYLGGSSNLISESIPLTNADASPEHFSFIPQEQFAAVRTLRQKNLKITGLYHSHPASSAQPSPEDIRLAFDPAVRYLIVSLAGRVPVLRSFFIVNGEVHPDELIVADSLPAVSITSNNRTIKQ